MPLSLTEFTEYLTASGLMDAAAIAESLSSLLPENQPLDGEALARELVKQKRLTKFQAEQVFAGKGKSLTLGNYVILDKLGQGGMGMVLKAWHRRMERTVALKVIAPKVVKDAVSLKRFQREVVAAAKLSHPNIVAAHDADEAKGTHFLVMEFVEGVDLAAHVKKHGPMPIELAVTCIVQAARGLAYAHEKGVVHRDIKPHNLLLDQAGAVKILDMGLARIEAGVGGSAAHADLTNSGAMMGTVDYMAPEQAMDSKHADARSDIYSLGCTLFYLMTGHATFVADTVMKRLTAHQNSSPPSLAEEASKSFVTWHRGSSTGSSGSSAQLTALNAIFQRMVTKRPADRFQSMSEVIAALEQCRSGIDLSDGGATTADSAMRNFFQDISGEGSSTPRTAANGSQRTAVLPGADEATIVEPELARDTDATLRVTIAREALTRTSAPKRPSRRVLVAGVLVAALLVAIGFLAMRGPTGTLHLEVGDELTQVTIGETGRIVKGTSEQDLRLPTGEYVLHIEREKLAFDTDPFEVTKNETVAIKVERVGRAVRAIQGKTILGRKEEPRPGAPTNPRGVPSAQAPADVVAAPATGESDRAVAEWVINNRSNVVLVGQTAVITKVADLPQQPFAVAKVTISNVRNFSETDAQRLTQLRELSVVEFFGTTLDVGVLHTLAGCRCLEELRVSGGSTPDAALSEVLQIRQLRILHFSSVAVTDETVARLGELSHLHFLQISDNKQMTEDGLVRLAAAPPPKLNTLDCGGGDVKLSSVGIKAIASLPHLQVLSFGIMDSGDDVLVELGHCPTLASVTLLAPSVTQAGTMQLQQALSGCQIQVSKSEQAPSLYGPAYRETLRHLMARGFTVAVTSNASKGMIWIAGENPFPKGDVVFANWVSPGSEAGATVEAEPADLQRIAQLTDLRNLRLEKIPVNGLRELLPLKNLCALSIGSPLTDADIALLPSFTKLSELSVIVPSDAALESIAKLPHLSRLVLRFGSKFTDNGLKALESARVLSRVAFGESGVSLAAAQAFATARPDVIVTWKGGQRLLPSDDNLNGPTPPSAKAPFDAQQARAHQEAWAKHLGTKVETTNSVGAKMILIPPGEFLMGSTDEQVAAALKVADEVSAEPIVKDDISKAERPQHNVVITRPFLMSSSEVTIGQFQKFVGASKYMTEAEKYGFGDSTNTVVDDTVTDAHKQKNWRTPGYIVTDDSPVAQITWNDAAAYCQWLSAQEKKIYRLPTEAEWEYACRAGTTTLYTFGDNHAVLDQFAWCNTSSNGRPRAVATKLPNAFGLSDLYGNLWEWCGDWYDTTWYEQSATNDPIGPSSGTGRVYRGGTYHSNAAQIRSAFRNRGAPSQRRSSIGFRIVQVLDVPAPPLAKTPFDANQARAHQEAWAKHLGTTVETTNSVGAKLTLIPPGEFLMGSTDEQVSVALKAAEAENASQVFKDFIEKGERPQHRVVITKPYLMGTTEVTIGQFRKFVEASEYVTEAEQYGFANSSSKTIDDKVNEVDRGKSWRSPGYPTADDLPVAFVSWNDAVAYCQWLSELEKTMYRLPTEAEWEYACRAGTTTQYSFGDDEAMLDPHGWYKNNAGGKSHPVGSMRPNGFGLHDLHGNLSEWCQDWSVMTWYEKSPSNDPFGPTTGSQRVLRGGSLFYKAADCRSASRGSNSPSHRSLAYGFRVVRVFDEPAPPPAKAPFDAKQARAHQEAWAKHLGTTVETTNSVGAKMILIPPGEFLMGVGDEQIEAAAKMRDEKNADQAGKDDLLKIERPQHRVILSKPFLMGATEVTIGQFRQFVDATKYVTEAEQYGFGNSRESVVDDKVTDAQKKMSWRAPGYSVTDDSPVTQISWKEAVAYCQWLSKQESTTYRLPTEAEWECACRAGSTTQFSFGDNESELEKHDWYKNNAAGQSHPVGTRRPNAFGLFDMLGNVQEWCGDFFDEQWYEQSPTVDPTGPTNRAPRVVRGGNLQYPAFFSRSSHRTGSSAANRFSSIGFRVVRVLDVRSSMSAKQNPG